MELWTVVFVSANCWFIHTCLASTLLMTPNVTHPQKSANDVNKDENVSPIQKHDPSTTPRDCEKITEFPLMIIKPMDCEEYLRMGYKKSGVYTIWPRNKLLNDKSLDVFCDMETDKGGWTVLQRRGDFLRPNDYFYKDWVNYKAGFGDVERDFWLGNDNIFALTNQRPYSIRFDLTDIEGKNLYALYDTFYVEDEESKYKLIIQDYSGTANDSMKYHNGHKFSTKDQENDNHNSTNCAVAFKGGWWYDSCHIANLNGLYLKGKHETYADGVNWKYWKGYHESLYATEMKIRPKNFRRSTV